MSIAAGAFESRLPPGSAALFAEFGAQAEAPPNGDPTIGSFHAAAQESYATNQGFRNLINRYVSLETVDNASYQANKVFKAAHSLYMPFKVRTATGYPYGYDELTWMHDITANLSDARSPQSIEMRANLRRPLQTSRDKRAIVLSFLAGALSQEREFEGGLTVHDYGSSSNHVLKSLALRHPNYAKIVDAQGHYDKSATRIFNMFSGFYKSGRGLMRGYGIEAQPPTNNPRAQNWLKSCSLDPSQLDPPREQVAGVKEFNDEDTYELLTEARPPQVHTIRGNFLNLSPEHHHKLASNKADLAFFSHVLSQNAPHISTISKNTMPLLKRRGMIVVNEYAEVPPDNPQTLNILDDWYASKWLCQTFVLSKASPELGFLPIIRWESSHCEVGQIVEENISHIAPDLAA
ncbi:MAG: hypothetical protein JWN38_946 [Candidatus Saccharibacteria bacterium]|nr:hypothetical protein [Candidatus Saccharibacteria bacterium]